MLDAIVVVRRPKRKTHIAMISGAAMCRVAIPDIAPSAIIEMRGGVTPFIVASLRREFNDDTCCKRCTAIVAMLVLIYRNRDKGKA